MVMVPDEKDQFKVKLSFRSCLGNLKNVIEERLKEPYLSVFKDSCFGHLLNVPSLKFQGQLVAHLLFCQDESRSASKLVFHVEWQEASMGCVEFALIIGLHFGSFPASPNKSTFYEKVFGGYKHGLVVDDIQLDLKRYSEIQHEGQTTLKLVMLYTLYGVLLCPGHSKNLDEKWIHLVDDLNRFNEYPWSRVAFEALAFEIHECMRKRLLLRIDEKRNDLTRTQEMFDVCGFVQALQVWAYEMLPSVGQFCGKKVADASKIKPRLLRWTTSESAPRFKDLKFKCFRQLKLRDEGNGVSVLKPDRFESQLDYYRSVHIWRDEMEKNGDEGHSAREERMKKKMKGVVVEENTVGGESVANQMLVRACDNIKKLVEEIAELKKCCFGCWGKMAIPLSTTRPTNLSTVLQTVL